MGQYWEARTGGGEAWRDALMGRVTRIARQRLKDRRAMLKELVAGNRRSEDDAGAPTQRDDLEVADLREQMRVLEAIKTIERHDLREVEAALERLDNGTWGLCERCEGPIGLQRLNALPEARLCIRCGAAAVKG